jgi:hypothetical protein
MYWTVSGSEIVSEYRLKLDHGRLVEGSRVEWNKPRKLPR